MIEWLRDRIDNYKLPVDATDSNEASKHQINDEIDEDKAQVSSFSCSLANNQSTYSEDDLSAHTQTIA